MHHVLCGLAANPALPSELVDRLISVADDDIARELACRADLSRAQAVALAERVGESAVTLAYRGRLTATDIDPAARPDAALALLDRGIGRPEWARLLAVDPVRERREKLAACSGLPADVVDTLAADPDVRVVAELALWTTSDVAARLARHPHAEVRRAVAGNEATPPAVLAALVTGEGLPAARHCLVCDREETPRHRGAPASALLVCLRDSEARPVAAGHPALPPTVVVELLADEDRQVAAAAAANPSLPSAVMRDLTCCRT